MTMSSTKNSHVKVGKQTPPVNHVDVVFPELLRLNVRSVLRVEFAAVSISRRPVEKQMLLPANMLAILVEEQAQKVKLKKNPSSRSLLRRLRRVAINRNSASYRNNPTVLTTLV